MNLINHAVQDTRRKVAKLLTLVHHHCSKCHRKPSLTLICWMLGDLLGSFITNQKNNQFGRSTRNPQTTMLRFPKAENQIQIKI